MIIQLNIQEFADHFEQFIEDALSEFDCEY